MARIIKAALIALLLFSSVCAAQSRICIIGTIHEPRDWFNADTLYNVLERIHPDMILTELDSTFFTSSFAFDLERYPDLLSTNENIACQRYKTAHKEVVLRPYDITGRNDFYRGNDFHIKENAMLGDIIRMGKENQLPDCVASEFEVLWTGINILGGIKYVSIGELNSNASQSADEMKQVLLDSLTVSIVENTPELNNWKEFARLRRDFWTRRNRVMAANIIRTAEAFPDATIVVLTGHQHKYFLTKLLEESGITTEEYRELAGRK